MSAEIGGALIGGAVAGSVLTWAFCNEKETDEQARLREERCQREEEHLRKLKMGLTEAQIKRWDDMLMITPPSPGTLRYECVEHPESLPVMPLNRIFKFIDEHGSEFDGFATSLDITGEAEAFFNRIKECKSEYEARHYILAFKDKLEFKIKNSDIPDEYKEKFHIVLNPIDGKAILCAIVSVLALVYGASYAVICAAPVGFLAAPIAYGMVRQFCPEMRSFSIESGAAADPNAFRVLIAELNSLITQTENAMRPSLRV